MGLLATLFPHWALKRAMARRKLAAVTSLYEAAKPGRMHPLRGSSLAPDSIMERAGWRLRDAARDLDENHDLITGLLDDLVNWTVGTGLTVEPMVLLENGDPAEDLNNELRLAYAEWGPFFETTGEAPRGEAERLIARSLFRDGEILVHHIVGGRYPYRSRVPYVVELLEADFLPFEYSRPSGQGRARIVQGVEKDAYGRPLAYHVWKVHPGETGYAYPVNITGEGTKRVSAEAITHLKFSRRVRQTRGVPLLHSIIRRVEDIKDIEDSERIAARVDADITAILRNMPEMGEDTTRGEDVHREFEVGGGMMVHTFDAEEMKMHTPTRPNTGLEAFRSGQLRMVAAGTGSRYSAIAKDYNGTYSAQRQELVEGRIAYDRLREYLVSRFYRGMWRRFVDSAVLGYRLPLAGVDRRSLYMADFRGPAMPWIDPKKEIEAFTAKVNAGFASRTQVIRDLGDDPQAVDRQREADTSAPSGSPDEPPADDEPEDDDSVQALRSVR